MVKELELGKIMDFNEVVSALISGELPDGAVIQKSIGEKAIVDNGSLYWITSGQYINAVVGVSEDVLGDVWKVVDLPEVKEISFSEGLALLNIGEKVTFVTEDQESYTVDSFFLLEEKVLDTETLSDLYNGYCLVTAEDETEGGAYIGGAETVTKESVGRKLTEENVHNIHFLADVFGDTAEQLADQFGITPRMVYYILEGTYWKHVKDRYDKDKRVGRA